MSFSSSLVTKKEKRPQETQTTFVKNAEKNLTNAAKEEIILDQMSLGGTPTSCDGLWSSPQSPTSLVSNLQSRSTRNPLCAGDDAVSASMIGHSGASWS